MDQSRKRILLVDDEPDTMGIVALDLTSEGFEVRVADSGESAIAVASKEHFDVALTDLRMPGLDGRATVVALKEIDPHLPVIILTGAPSVQTAIDCIRCGAQDYLEKPASLTEIEDAVARALDSRLRGSSEPGAALLRAADPPARVLLVLKAARRELLTDAVGLAICTQDGGLEVHESAFGRPPSAPLVRAVAARALEARAALAFSAAGRTSPLAELEHEFGDCDEWLAYALACPLSARLLTFGVLEFFRGAASPAFTAHDFERALRFTRELAELLAELDVDN